MRSAAILLAFGLTTGLAPASRVHVSLVGRLPVLTAGEAWTAKLAVRPKSFSGSVRVNASGPRRITVRAKGTRGSYRARLILPVAGTWTLSATAGGSTSRLGKVGVRTRSKPLVFVYPTSVALEPSGSLLVAENGAGRVFRIDAAGGAKTLLAGRLSRPYSLAATSSGQILLSTDNDVVRLDTAPPVVVASAEEQIGPIAVAGHDLYFTTGNAAYRVPAGSHTPVAIARGLSAPHGIAVGAEGAVLISDTEHDLILRVEPGGAVSTFAQMVRPGGMVVAPDGTVYVCAASTERVVHLSAEGARLGLVGPRFRTPYGLSPDGSGGLYVAEATSAGHIRHVFASGKVTTLKSSG